MPSCFIFYPTPTNWFILVCVHCEQFWCGHRQKYQFVISDVHAPTEHSLVCVCSARCVCQQRKAWKCSWPHRHPTLLKWELLAFSISLRTSEWAIVIHCSVHCLSASLCTPLAGMVCSKMVCLFLDLNKKILRPFNCTGWSQHKLHSHRFFHIRFKRN